MPTYSDGIGYGGVRTAGFPANSGESPVVKYSVELDFAAIALARSNAGAEPLAIGDILSIPLLPAGCVVLATGFEVTKAESLAATATVAVDVGAVAVRAAATIAAVAAFAVTTAELAQIDDATPMEVTLAVAVPLNGKVRATVVAIDPS